MVKTLIQQPDHRPTGVAVALHCKITFRNRERLLHVRIGFHHRGKHPRLCIVDELVKGLEVSGEFLG
jgi:hypothetical protein